MGRGLAVLKNRGWVALELFIRRGESVSYRSQES